ncbi:protein spinster homolog 1 isoform X3 [Paramisgurnus dabryanus]|uniref:protein spinster homolog 1 isoform X3 n=2 Tax=Paramisgurnus dabryanus TaxID=90735 RepID=UPI0031F46404
MADRTSDSDGDAPVSDSPKQRPKRRRIIDPTSITTVPIYSNKVNRSLNLKPTTFTQSNLTEEEKDGPLWSPPPPRTEKQSTSINLSDSEEEPQQIQAQEILRSPSPPPPCSPPVKQSRQANQKIKKLDAIGSFACLSPVYQEPVIEYRNSPSPVNDDDDDEIIILSDNKRKRRHPNTEHSDVAREISLKFRCRTELHKIPILSTAPLSKAVEQLAIKLSVRPSQILLLRKDVELPVHSSVSELGLGIADIIAVMSGEPADTTPFFSDDNEGEGPTENGAVSSPPEEESASGVSSSRAILTVAVLCYINLLNYMDRFTVAGVLTDIEKFFKISDGKSGLLQTVFICSYMFLAPLFGYLGDRYNRKLIMSGGILFWSIVTLASSFVGKDHFWALLLTRGLVGVGEASYSTIAPTIIADLFIKEKRTNMLSIFYFAIPVGSGFGYIVGSRVAAVAKDWHWALRVTPGLGLLAVILLIFVVQEPKRGAIEAHSEDMLHRTSWLEDMKALCRNHSFVLSTFGFTAVAFVTGSLALWAPAFLFRAGVFNGEKQPCFKDNCDDSGSLIFGIITIVTGILGVASGVQASKKLRTKTPRADPLVCATGLLLAAPFLYLSIMFAQVSTVATYVFIFFGETFLSMNWAIVADILLYVVIPTRRSTAEAFQIVLSHLLGDAISPYLIGVVSDSIKSSDSYMWEFRSLQISLLLCSFVAVGGGAFFLATAFFIEKDRNLAENYVPSDDAPIVVPKRGRSTKVSVSSVLI